MDVINALKTRVFPSIDKHLGFNAVNYFLLITFVCSGFTKVAPPMHQVGYALWPTLIKSTLLFILIGVWELTGVMLYHQKMFIPAYTMLFMFMGGVFSAISIVSLKAIGAIILFIMYALTTTIFLLYTATQQKDIEQVTSNAFLLIGIGYVIGFVLHIISPKEKNAKAKQ